MEFIELLIIQPQKVNENMEMTVCMGIDNIKRLWALFVKEPNFASDQTQFLNWVNKVRIHSVQRLTGNSYG